jgi:hypothetical protein
MTVSYNRNVSAAEFFGKIVPDIAAKKVATLSAAQKGIEHAIALQLVGSEVGAWTFALAGGGVQVSDGIADHANPICRLDARTWRDAMEGLNEVLGDLLKFESILGLVEETDLSGLDPELLNLLEPLTGRSLEIHIKDSDDTTIGIRFGTAAPETPSLKLSLDPPTIRAIAAGRLQPAGAFMAGRIMLDGDMELAMLMAGFIPQLLPYLPKNLAALADRLSA